MKKIFNNMLKNRWGYVSIETVIIAGLVIALGAYALTEFYVTSKQVVGLSIHNVKKPFLVVHSPSEDFEEIEL